MEFENQQKEVVDTKLWLSRLRKKFALNFRSCTTKVLKVFPRIERNAEHGNDKYKDFNDKSRSIFHESLKCDLGNENLWCQILKDMIGRVLEERT